MPHKVVLSPDALQRISEIAQYIATQLCLKKSAGALYDGLAEKIDIIEAFPYSYAIDEDASRIIGHTVRSARLRSAKLLYWVDEEQKTVLIFTVRFCSENPLSLRKEDFPY